MKEINGTRAYLKTLRKLRKLTAQSYPNGGWLPASREMCKKFKVNRKTYSKALQCLEKDGVAKVYPKKGHYINPEFLRAKKIGIIIGDAGDCPFFQSDQVLCSVFNVLRDNHFNGQLIQVADLNNILDKALIHGVKGLIWLFPPQQALPNIRNIETSDFPIVIVTFAGFKEESCHGVAVVKMNPDNVDKVKIDFFTKRNHKKVAIVGRMDIANRIKKQFIPLFRKENIEAVFITHDLNGKVADLSILSKDSTISGLIIDGGAGDHYKIFDALSKLKKNSLSDIYVHYSEQLETIRSMYPEIKVTAIGSSDIEILGETAVRILMDRLLNGKPLTSKKVGGFRLRAVQK